MNIILASGSPRRKQLLESIGIADCRVITPDVDEDALSGLPPQKLVESLSRLKAGAVRELVSPDDIVIAADTMVVLGGALLGKPHDADDARAMLAALSGRRHEVYTGVTVLCGEHCVTEHEVTRVTFRDLTPDEITDYVSTGEPLDKAGAYGIQGFGALLVAGVEGDYPNVMGLPLARLGAMLARFGVDTMKLAAKR